MTEKVKPLIKRIEELCTPIFKLGNEKGVKSKDLEKHYNKTPLAELAFNLFACLYDTKKQLEDQNRQLAKATNALKEQDRKIQKLDTSLEEMENTAAGAEQSTLAEVLAEVKKNGERITEMETKMKESQEKIVTETEKVSSYAEILKKSKDGRDKESILHPKKLVNGVMSEIKNSDRKKNLIFYGVPGIVEKSTNRIDYWDNLEDILIETGFANMKPSSMELLKPEIDCVTKDTDEPLIPCTLRVQFPTEAIAYRILKNAPRLKASSFLYGVYVAPDRTPTEQKERMKLVEQLKMKIKEQPTIKWAIRKGKVVNCGKWEGPIIPVRLRLETD